MKSIFVLIFLLVCKFSFGQQMNGDTLLIKYMPSVKYIKYGDRVYEIISPSLQEVQPKSNLLNFKTFLPKGAVFASDTPRIPTTDFLYNPTLSNSISADTSIIYFKKHPIPQKVRKKH